MWPSVVQGPVYTDGRVVFHAYSIWSAYTHRGLFQVLGQLHLTAEGYPCWRGRYNTALCQFRDNIVLGTDTPHAERTGLVNQVRGILQRAWGLRVVCESMNDKPQRVGDCCTAITKVMGYVLVREPKGTGIVFIEPSALTARWELRLGPTLLTPRDAYKATWALFSRGAQERGTVDRHVDF